jgi:hypothetical protein
VALFSVSWLFGSGFYRPGSQAVWILAVGTGAALLAGFPLRLPSRSQSLLAVAMLAPAVWFFPGPYRAAPGLLVAGLLMASASIPRRWPVPLAHGLVAAGLVLLVQSLAVELYIVQTARSHDLPWPLPSFVGAVARLFAADVGVDGTTVVLGTLRGPLRLGATWDLVLDPATLALLVGGLVLLALSGGGEAEQAGLASWSRRAGRLALLVGAWLPIRLGLLMALVVHRSVRWDPAERFNVMGQFLSPWVHLVLLVPPLIVAWQFLPKPAQRGPSRGPFSPTPEERVSDSGGHVAAGWRYAAALVLVLVALGALAWAGQWEPVGQRLGGRVMVMERHSTWEPTTPPYDTTRFGENASYTYAAIYDFLSRYYEMSRLLESDPINDAKLATCDVLMVKTLTAPLSAEEVAAIERFVRRGGGLLMIGEHTDVFKSSSHANAIARQFGFKFRLDLLFWLRNPYVQVYEPPRVPHPIVQRVPRMTFAVSCSVDPGWSFGRAAVRNTGLWNLPPEYHTENFFPEAEYRPEMRYGSFVQLWTTRSGEGRVAAWTDSTIFSNFSTFEPGKTELMLGILEWLNHRSVFDRALPRWLLLGTVSALACACLIGGLYLGWRRRTPVLVVLAAGACGVVLGSELVIAMNRSAMPAPQPVRPMVRVVIDRTVSDAPLSVGGFTQDNGLGYGLLEQWIPRLGYFTARRAGQSAFDGDALVVVCPTRSVSDEFRKGLIDYVAAGGKLLVIDSPDVVGSTANSLLWPFGMTVNHASSRKGKLGLDGGWPGIPVEAVCEVIGGQPFMWVEGLPVASRTCYGGGRVMAIGFGSLMNDAGLGSHWMTEANPEMLTRSDLLFTLVRALLEDRPVVAPPPRKPQSDASAPKTRAPKN